MTTKYLWGIQLSLIIMATGVNLISNEVWSIILTWWLLGTAGIPFSFIVYFEYRAKKNN